MTRFIDADSWAKAPIKRLLAHAQTIVDAEIANCALFHDATSAADVIPMDDRHRYTSVNKTTEAQRTELVGAINTGDGTSDNVDGTTEGQVKTNVSHSHPINRIPRFDPDEIKIGRVVGRGGFCVVSEVREIRLMNHQRRGHSGRSNNTGATADLSTTETTNRKNHTRFWNIISTSDSSIDVSQNTNVTTVSETVGTRAQLAREVWTKPGGKVVVKQVNREFIETDRSMYLKGIIDIAMEAKFLANLNHINIIPLRGECCYSPFESTEYFIILDYLPRTLPNRLNEWMHVHRATKGITGFCTSLGTGNEKKIKRLMTDRLLIAYDIAAAGNYLHKKNIIYRDFKPDNVGFTSLGVTKLMDFGLAREVTNLEKDEDGLYQLTGLTGGIRYMAPEVGLQRPYNTAADVYSWSMIFWYILALEPPLCLYTPEMIIHRVFEKGHRPATKVSWNPALTDLLRQCWTENVHERPTFKDVMKELFSIVQSYDPNVAALITSKNEGV